MNDALLIGFNEITTNTIVKKILNNLIPEKVDIPSLNDELSIKRVEDKMVFILNESVESDNKIISQINTIDSSIFSIINNELISNAFSEKQSNLNIGVQGKIPLTLEGTYSLNLSPEITNLEFCSNNTIILSNSLNGELDLDHPLLHSSNKIPIDIKSKYTISFNFDSANNKLNFTAKMKDIEDPYIPIANIEILKNIEDSLLNDIKSAIINNAPTITISLTLNSLDALKNINFKINDNNITATTKNITLKTTSDFCYIGADVEISSKKIEGSNSIEKVIDNHVTKSIEKATNTIEKVIDTNVTKNIKKTTNTVERAFDKVENLYDRVKKSL